MTWESFRTIGPLWEEFIGAIWCGALMLFVVTLNKFLNKQSSYGWFETQWRWCDVIVLRCSWSQCVLCWCWPLLCFGSTHLPLDKMASFSQTIFSDAFSLMKSFVFGLKFPWSLFLKGGGGGGGGGWVKISLKFVPEGGGGGGGGGGAMSFNSSLS